MLNAGFITITDTRVYKNGNSTLHYSDNYNRHSIDYFSNFSLWILEVLSGRFRYNISRCYKF